MSHLILSSHRLLLFLVLKCFNCDRNLERTVYGGWCLCSEYLCASSVSCLIESFDFIFSPSFILSGSGTS